MYFIIYFLNLITYIGAFLKTNKMYYHNKLYASPLYEKPSWKMIEKSMKKTARNWFVSRAEKRGIEWNNTLHYYKNYSNSLNYWK